MVFGDRLPSSGRSAITMAAATGPMPGTERSSCAAWRRGGSAATSAAMRLLAGADGLVEEGDMAVEILGDFGDRGLRCGGCVPERGWPRAGRGRRTRAVRRARSGSSGLCGGGRRAWAMAASMRASMASVLARKPAARAKARARFGIDAGMGDAALRSSAWPQQAVVGAGGLEQDEGAGCGEALGQRRRSASGVLAMALGPAGCAIEDIEMVFGDVDSDEARGYDHGACPCGARSAANGLVQLFRWSKSGRGPSPSTD